MSYANSCLVIVNNILGDHIDSFPSYLSQGFEKLSEILPNIIPTIRNTNITECDNQKNKIDFNDEETNISLEILIQPTYNELKESVKCLTENENTKEIYIVYIGSHGTGYSSNWLLEDRIFSANIMLSILNETSWIKSDSMDEENLANLRIDKNKLSNEKSRHQDLATMNILTPGNSAHWNKVLSTLKIKETKQDRVRVFSFSPEISIDESSSFSKELEEFCKVLYEKYQSVLINKAVLEKAENIGTLQLTNKSGSFYIFDEACGQSSLLALNGFNLLIDAGYKRKPEFWNFLQRFEKIDTHIISSWNETNLFGIESFLDFKSKTNEINGLSSPNLNYCIIPIGPNPFKLNDKIELKSLLEINMTTEAQKIIQKIKSLEIPFLQMCRDPKSTSASHQLYFKLGQGYLDAFPLWPCSSETSGDSKRYIDEWQKDSKTQSIYFDELVKDNANAFLLIWNGTRTSPESSVDEGNILTRILMTSSCHESHLLKSLEEFSKINSSCNTFSGKPLEKKLIEKKSNSADISKKPATPSSISKETSKLTASESKANTTKKPGQIISKDAALKSKDTNKTDSNVKLADKKPTIPKGKQTDSTKILDKKDLSTHKTGIDGKHEPKSSKLPNTTESIDKQSKTVKKSDTSEPKKIVKTTTETPETKKTAQKSLTNDKIADSVEVKKHQKKPLVSETAKKPLAHKTNDVGDVKKTTDVSDTKKIIKKSLPNEKINESNEAKKTAKKPISASKDTPEHKKETKKVVKEETTDQKKIIKKSVPDKKTDKPEINKKPASAKFDVDTKKMKDVKPMPKKVATQKISSTAKKDDIKLSGSVNNKVELDKNVDISQSPLSDHEKSKDDNVNISKDNSLINQDLITENKEIIESDKVTKTPDENLMDEAKIVSSLIDLIKNKPNEESQIIEAQNLKQFGIYEDGEFDEEHIAENEEKELQDQTHLKIDTEHEILDRSNIEEHELQNQDKDKEMVDNEFSISNKNEEHEIFEKDVPEEKEILESHHDNVESEIPFGIEKEEHEVSEKEDLAEEEKVVEAPHDNVENEIPFSIEQKHNISEKEDLTEVLEAHHHNIVESEIPISMEKENEISEKENLPEEEEILESHHENVQCEIPYCTEKEEKHDISEKEELSEVEEIVESDHHEHVESEIPFGIEKDQEQHEVSEKEESPEVEEIVESDHHENVESEISCSIEKEEEHEISEKEESPEVEEIVEADHHENVESEISCSIEKEEEHEISEKEELPEDEEIVEADHQEHVESEIPFGTEKDQEHEISEKEESPEVEENVEADHHENVESEISCSIEKEEEHEISEKEELPEDEEIVEADHQEHVESEIPFGTEKEEEHEISEKEESPEVEEIVEADHHENVESEISCSIEKEEEEHEISEKELLEDEVVESHHENVESEIPCSTEKEEEHENSEKEELPEEEEVIEADHHEHVESEIPFGTEKDEKHEMSEKEDVPEDEEIVEADHHENVESEIPCSTEKEDEHEISEKEELPEVDAVESHHHEHIESEIPCSTEKEEEHEILEKDLLEDEEIIEAEHHEHVESEIPFGTEKDEKHEMSEKEDVPEDEEIVKADHHENVESEIPCSTEKEEEHEILEKDLPEDDEIIEADYHEHVESEIPFGTEKDEKHEMSEKEDVPEDEEIIEADHHEHVESEIPFGTEKDEEYEISEKEELPEDEEIGEDHDENLESEIPCSTEKEEEHEISEKEELPEEEEVIEADHHEHIESEIPCSIEKEEKHEISEKNLPEEDVIEADHHEHIESEFPCNTEKEEEHEISEKEELPEDEEIVEADHHENVESKIPFGTEKEEEQEISEKEELQEDEVVESHHHENVESEIPFGIEKEEHETSEKEDLPEEEEVVESYHHDNVESDIQFDNNKEDGEISEREDLPEEEVVEAHHHDNIESKIAYGIEKEKEHKISEKEDLAEEEEIGESQYHDYIKKDVHETLEKENLSEDEVIESYHHKNVESEILFGTEKEHEISDKHDLPEEEEVLESHHHDVIESALNLDIEKEEYEISEKEYLPETENGLSFPCEQIHVHNIYTEKAENFDEVSEEHDLQYEDKDEHHISENKMIEKEYDIDEGEKPDFLMKEDESFDEKEVIEHVDQDVECSNKLYFDDDNYNKEKETDEKDIKSENLLDIENEEISEKNVDTNKSEHFDNDFYLGNVEKTDKSENLECDYDNEMPSREHIADVSDLVHSENHQDIERYLPDSESNDSDLSVDIVKDHTIEDIKEKEEKPAYQSIPILDNILEDMSPTSIVSHEMTDINETAQFQNDPTENKESIFSDDNHPGNERNTSNINTTPDILQGLKHNLSESIEVEVEQIIEDEEIINFQTNITKADSDEELICRGFSPKQSTNLTDRDLDLGFPNSECQEIPVETLNNISHKSDHENAPGYVNGNKVDSTLGWNEPLGLPMPTLISTKPTTKSSPAMKTTDKGAGSHPASAKLKSTHSPAAKPNGTAANHVSAAVTQKVTDSPKGAPTPKPSAPKSAAPATKPLTQKPPKKPEIIDHSKFPAFYMEIAYIPVDSDGNVNPTRVTEAFFTRIRARQYILPGLEHNCQVLDSFLAAKRKWTEDDNQMEIQLIPIKMTETLRKWAMENSQDLSQLNIKIGTPVENCSVRLEGDNSVPCIAHRIDF